MPDMELLIDHDAPLEEAAEAIKSAVNEWGSLPVSYNGALYNFDSLDTEAEILEALRSSQRR